MRIGFAQINTTVGDLPGNRDLLLNAYQELVQAGAELVLSPELSVCGYPPRDLLLKPRFLRDTRAMVEEIARATGAIPLLVGFAEARETKTGREAWNAAAWCQKGGVQHIAHKMLLPTYDVFDEDRYFAPAEKPLLVEHAGIRIAVTICEDLWTAPEANVQARYQKDPVRMLAEEKPDLVVNLSASPWHLGKGEQRERVVAHAAREIGCPVAYANAVGGNDELIFDGGSIIAGPDGVIRGRLSSFVHEVKTLDSHGISTLTDTPAPMEELRRALVLGVRDYCHKSGFFQAVLGLSGGIDSAVTAAIAAEALGPEKVLGVALPSAISSAHSLADAERLARNLGIDYRVLPIEDIVTAIDRTLAPVFTGTEPDVAEENVQARTRGLLLMALSNKFQRMLLTTGNKSELAVGYCTLYGDMAGGLAVISDVPKTRVYELARHLNADRERIPENTIRKPPSAELRPDQTDQDSLPPYDVLDAILEGYVERHESAADLAHAGVDPALAREITRKVDRNEYKRKQAAPGLKTTPVAFGTGRRIPLVQRYVAPL